MNSACSEGVAAARDHAPEIVTGAFVQQFVRAPAALAVDDLYAVFCFAQHQGLGLMAVLDEGG